MAYLKAGTRLEKSPDSGYIVTRDINYGETVKPSQFKVYGDAEPVIPGMQVPKWLGPAMQKARGEP